MILDCIFANQILFMASENIIEEKKQGQALMTEKINGNSKKLFIESYGCQMNLNDSEIVAAIIIQ